MRKLTTEQFIQKAVSPQPKWSIVTAITSDSTEDGYIRYVMTVNQ